MGQSEHVVFLLEELDQWRARELIDAATHERLRWFCAARYPMAADALDARRGASGALRSEAATQSVDPFERELDAEVQAHFEVEQRAAEERDENRSEVAAATAQPVSSRMSAVGSAVLEAAADALAVDRCEPEPPSVEDQVVARESKYSSLFGSLINERALWLAGGLLTVAGSLYFLGLAWDRLDSGMLHAVVAAALHAYAAAFFGVGLTLIRRRQAHSVGRILFGFTVLLLPLANLAVGELGAVLMQSSVPLGALIGAGTLLVTVIGQGAMLAVIGGLYERRSIAPLVQTGLALAVLTALVAPLSVLPVPSAAWVVLVALAFVAFAKGCFAGANRLNLPMSAWLLGGGSLWAFGVLVVRLQLAAAFEFTHYASLLAAVAALLVFVDGRLRSRAGHPPRLAALGMCLHGASLLAVALSVAGLVLLGYFDLSARLTVLVTAAITAALFARAAWLHGRSAMTYLAALVGLLAYFFLPAPFLRLMQLANQWASGALGYAGAPLPVAYYGLTFIPYLLLIAWAARRLGRSRPDLSTDLVRFLMAIGGLLVALALTSVADLRPMLWTWPLYAIGSWLAVKAFRVERLVYAGHGLAIATVGVLGVWALRAGYALPPSMLLAVCAALVAAAASRRRMPKHLLHAALVALAAVPVAGLLGGHSAATLAMTQGAAALALALLVSRTRSVPAAVAAGVLAWTATATICVAHELSLEASFAVMLGFGAFGSAVAAAGGKAPAGSLRHEALRRAAVVSSALGLILAFSIGLFTEPSWAPLVAAAGLGLLALLSRGVVLTPLSAVTLAIAGALSVDGILPGAWPLALSSAACAYLVLAAGVPTSWPAARGRARALATVSVGVLVVALCALWWRALPGAVDASWWGFAANSSVLCFALTAALIHRARRPDFAALLLGVVAVFSALASSFVLEALVEVPPAVRVWVHGSVWALASLAWTMIARRVAHEPMARAARWIACVLPLPAAAIVAAAAFISALWGPWLIETPPGTSGSWLDGSVYGILCAALALSAVRKAAELRERTIGWHLALVALIGLALAAAATLFGAANLAIPTALIGLGLGVAAVNGDRLFGRAIPLFWSLVVLAIALVATHADFDHGALSLAMACLTTVLFFAWRRRQAALASFVAGGFALALSATAQVAMLWLASELSTGQYPPTAVLALLGPAAVLAALLLRLVGEVHRRGSATRPVVRHAHANLLVAAGLAVVAVVVNGDSAAPFVVPVALATLGAVIVLAVLFGRSDRRPWLLHAAAVIAPAMYVVARSQTGLVVFGPWLDCAVLLSAAQLAFWLGRRFAQRDPNVAQALQSSAVWWPMLCALIMPGLGPSGAALLALLVAVHYAALAQVARDRHLSVPAMVFGNVALFSSWAALGWSDLLAYALPVGATLLALIHVYAEELGRRPRKILRRVVVASLYVLGVSDALVAATPVQALVIVPLLCVAGIAIGALSRVRVYLVMGVVFLGVDLTLTMLRYGLQSRPLGALFLTLLGLLLVSAMVMFSLDRERILRRYSMVLGELRGWE